jgi:hypothetical protein
VASALPTLRLGPLCSQPADGLPIIRPVEPLPRPDGLGQAELGAIAEAETRLCNAQTTTPPDLRLVVGTAKELCETVAKIVIAERGNIYGGKDDMPALVTQAHKVLASQPGPGLAMDPATQKIAQGLKSIVLGLTDLRNSVGTGHGRSTVPDVVDENGSIAVDACRLWCSWALRRLGPYIAGSVTGIVRALDADTFRRGELASRLGLARMAELPTDEQRRLGIAVARRALRDTFVVRIDGIDAIDSSDAKTWPSGYVEGVILGLFIDADGGLVPADWKTHTAARLLAGMDHPLAVLNNLESEIARTSMSLSVVRDDSSPRAGAAAFLSRRTMFADEAARAAWDKVGELIVRQATGMGDQAS